MSEPVSAAERPSLQLVRLPIDKPQAAVEFLHARSNGVMDLIAHFWERLPQTPPLQRGELHLVACLAGGGNGPNEDITIHTLDVGRLSGVMLYVPKAHRAHVRAMDPPTAEAFAAYIHTRGAQPVEGTGETEPTTEPSSTHVINPANSLSVKDLTGIRLIDNEQPNGNGRIAIDFLTGAAEGIAALVPLLLPLVHKKTPARQLVNVVMQLPAMVTCAADPHVRPATSADLPTLNRWRKQYKEERGILFDADMDASVADQRVFVYELDKQVVTLAKFDLELQRLIEIGGVYTFPEYRRKGYGGKIVGDLAERIRARGKVPTLQVDQENKPALKLYTEAGWREMGSLARVWLTG